MTDTKSSSWDGSEPLAVVSLTRRSAQASASRAHLSVRSSLGYSWKDDEWIVVATRRWTPRRLRLHVAAGGGGSHNQRRPGLYQPGLWVSGREASDREVPAHPVSPSRIRHLQSWPNAPHLYHLSACPPLITLPPGT